MKALTMYRPHTIQNALSDFDRYFESFFGDSLFTPATRILTHQPAVDIRETEKAYILEMELPCYDENNLTVHIDGGKLTISTKQEETTEEKKDQGTTADNGNYVLRERRLTAFSRTFKLPENTDAEAVNANFKNGVLSLEIQKRPEAQKRTIQITAA